MQLADLLAAGIGRRSLLVGGVAGVAALAGVVPQRSLFVLGDSWAAGLHADPAHALGQVAAAALGWQADVDAVSGTGYLTATADGSTYPARAAAIASSGSARLVVLQGGSNDDGKPHQAIPGALVATVDAVRDRLPRAKVVVLGPGPDPLPVTAQQADVDRVLQRAAAGLRVPYVSMLQEQWIPTGSTVLDPGNHHPTVAGQRYLGRRLAAALRVRFPQLTG